MGVPRYVSLIPAAPDDQENAVFDRNVRVAADRAAISAAIRELTPTLLREFVDKILVHEPDRSSGKRQQKIEIHYNFVGELAG